MIGRSAHIITANGRPLTVRLDGGVPLNMVSSLCEEGSATMRGDEEQSQLIETKSTKEVPSGMVSVLCCAIALFLAMTVGVLGMVVWISVKVEDITTQLEAQGTPTLSQMIKHVGAILNYTEMAVSHVEGMTYRSAGLLGRTVGVAEHALNVSDDIVNRVSAFSKNPAMTLLGGVG
jgi:hypothetical protein